MAEPTDIPEHELAVMQRATEAGVLLILDDGRHLLDSVGSSVWMLINGQNDLSTIAATIAHQYGDIDRDQVLTDVADFLDSLLEDDLIRMVRR